MDGWIKLHRKIRENPIFNDMNLFRLWMICLTEATHKERDQMVGKQIVKLLPGEFVTGRFDLAEMYNRGLKKKEQKPPTTIWRWLESLQNNDFLVIKSNNKFSVVAVLKWLEYQSDGQQNGQQVVNKWSTDGQQVVTNKNVKNDKNVENEENLKPLAEVTAMYDPEFELFWMEYPSQRKRDKAKSYTIWKKEVKSIPKDQLTECVKRYAKDKRAIGVDGKYAKMPTTFLNAKTYKDYLMTGGNDHASDRRSEGSTGKYSEFIIE
jgi:hypothetical protein